ncbi:hypothetical protein [Mycobacterium persicum]|nr:hypothetical protein [Mycobacterium persicum]ORB89292.1 hypothetical protein B1T49_08640 [Mycobacterium persicum]
MTETDADQDAAAPAACWRCGGPCASFKASVHGWTCAGCLERYLDAGAARWEARSEKVKERVTRNLLQGNEIRTPVTADRRREGGGPAAMCRTTVPASAPDDRVIRTGEDT